MKSLFALLGILLLAGCASNNTTTKLTPSDSGREIDTTVGQVLELKLPSNRTTGYGWVEQSAGAMILERCGEPDYETDKAPEGMVGVGGMEVWRFKAVKVGRETLRLEYIRPWETNVPPAKVMLFNVVVGE